MKKHRTIPGFGLSLGLGMLYCSLIVLLPLTLLLYKAMGAEPQQVWQLLTSQRVLSAAKVTFGCSALAALGCGIAGLLLAWCLERYKFAGRGFMDSLIDLPFALPTAVAGITLTQLYARDGWVGSLFAAWQLQLVYNATGICLALFFIGLPFVVRSLQPVIKQLDYNQQQAALSMGASRFQCFLRVIMPQLWPQLISGVAMAFARGIGEYGSVIFISGNMPYKTEILPLLIVNQLEEFNYINAAVLGAAMLLVSFLLLLIINLWQRRFIFARSN